MTAAIAEAHDDKTTHKTLMDYAVDKAKSDSSLHLPISGTMSSRGSAWSRMWEGAEQEDIIGEIQGETVRSKEHAYNPLINRGFLEGTMNYGTARDRSLSIWDDRMIPYFREGYLYQEETTSQAGGSWQQLGRVSHLLQDMTSPLHVFANLHLLYVWPCMYEGYWAQNQDYLKNSILSSVGSPLYTDGSLPSEATAKLDSYTGQRLQYWFGSSANNGNGPVGCPHRSVNDVRGYLEVLSWITYFRCTFWGEVKFGTSGSSGYATTATTTGTTFNSYPGDSTLYVGSKTNTLNTMFPSSVYWIASWDDNYYEIIDRKGNSFLWMSWSGIDDWSACGRTADGAGGWASGHKDSSIRVSGSDDDSSGARITGRFWFDTRELGKDEYNHYLYPSYYPDGTTMVDNLYLYYGKTLFPLTVRYNAGLLGMANRELAVISSPGTASIDLKRDYGSYPGGDNFGKYDVDTSTDDTKRYFASGEDVTLNAPAADGSQNAFDHWEKDGTPCSSSRQTNITLTANCTYTAVYVDKKPPQPNPMTWEAVPHATGQTSISMTATTATDPNGNDVEYFFDCTTAGGHDSGWQDSSTYEDTGLQANTPYTYWVKARDKSPNANETVYSVAKSATTYPMTLTIETSSLSGGTVGEAYSDALSASGGTPSYTWSISGGSLPAGLTLVASTGAISGTPTAPGTSSFTVSVTDSASATATKALSIAVSSSPLTITTVSLPSGRVGSAYSQTLAATGGVAPYTWMLSSGALPSGLTLDAATGVIGGTPTIAETRLFTVCVADSQAPHGTATQALSITVTSDVETYQFSASDQESSTVSTTYVSKTHLTISPPSADDWIIFGFCEFKSPGTVSAAFVQLFVDGIGEGQNTRRPVDPTDYMPFVTVKVKNLSAGPHTIRLMFKTANSSASAYVRNARICAVRKGALEFWNTARDAAVPLTSALQDILTLNWTPATAGNYLVISTAEVNATTAVSTRVQTTYNGAVNDEGIIRAADNGDFTTFMSFNFVTAGAGVLQTHKMAAAKVSADVTNHYIRRARILALRLTGGRFRYAVGGSATEQNTIQTTFQQCLTASWTYGTNGNWLLLNSARLNNSSTSCQTEIRVQANNASTCGQQLMKPKHPTDLLNFSSIDVLGLTSPHTVDMDWRTTAVSGTAKVKRLRFYGLPLDAQ